MMLEYGFYENTFSVSLELSCPAHSEYRLCSSHMSDCAENPSPPTVKCKEGCFCKPGFFHSSGNCLPNSECGCNYDGVYHEIRESFYPDEHCRLRCVCVGRDRVQCTNHTCQDGTKCAIQNGRRACHASHPVKCTVTGGRHFKSYDGHRFDMNTGSCAYVLSQFCDEKSDPTVIIHQGQLDVRVDGVNVSLAMETPGKVKVRRSIFTDTNQLSFCFFLKICLDFNSNLNFPG